MQITINRKTALGIPGEHANTEPWYADLYTLKNNEEAKFGEVVKFNDNNFGLVVSPHEHCVEALPSPTVNFTATAGMTIALAKAGVWFVAQKEDYPYVEGKRVQFSTGTAEVLKVEDGIVMLRLHLTGDPANTVSEESQEDPSDGE
jgi:hypothetical protein